MTRISDLPLHVAEAVRREAGNEPVLWVGQPDPGLVFRQATVLWWFAVPWCLITFAWEATVIGPWLAPWLIPLESLPQGNRIATIGMPLFGLPFVLVGAVTLLAPWFAARAARNQAHLVMRRGLATVTAARDGTFKTEKTELKAITKLERKDVRSGAGTLTIHRGQKRDSEGDLVDDTETWVGIRDTQLVERLISGLMRPA